MMLGRCVTWALLLSTLLLGPGCAGRRIRSEFEARQTTRDVLRPPGQVAAEAGGPYQLGVRLHPQLLERTLVEMLPENLLEGAAVKARPETAESGFGGRGLLGGLLRSFRGGADALTPTLKASDVTVMISPACDGCLTLDARLEGGLKSPEQRGMALTGQVRLGARLEAAQSEGQPAVSIGLREVEDLRLELPLNLPGPFSQIQTRLEDTLRDRLTQLIAERPEEAHRVLPIGDRFTLGPGVKLEGVSVHTLPSPGELFLGMDTNLLAPGTVSAGARGDVLREDWAVVLGEGVVEQLIQLSIQTKRIPSRFNRKGQPDPEGPVSFDFNGLRLTEQGFEIRARIWYLATPAWWRDYVITGLFELREGQPVPRILHMTPGAGSGATWLAHLAERRVTSERAVRGIGRVLPTEAPLPLGEERSAKMTATRIESKAGALIIAGTLTFADGARERPTRP